MTDPAPAGVVVGVTRLRSAATGWTDGIGHLRTFLGSLLTSTLFTATAAHGYYGWILWAAILCALVPSLLIGRFGITQRGWCSSRSRPDVHARG